MVHVIHFTSLSSHFDVVTHLCQWFRRGLHLFVHTPRPIIIVDSSITVSCAVTHWLHGLHPKLQLCFIVTNVTSQGYLSTKRCAKGWQPIIMPPSIWQVFSPPIWQLSIDDFVRLRFVFIIHDKVLFGECLHELGNVFQGLCTLWVLVFRVRVFRYRFQVSRKFISRSNMVITLDMITNSSLWL